MWAVRVRSTGRAAGGPRAGRPKHSQRSPHPGPAPRRRPSCPASLRPPSSLRCRVRPFQAGPLKAERPGPWRAGRASPRDEPAGDRQRARQPPLCQGEAGPTTRRCSPCDVAVVHEPWCTGRAARGTALSLTAGLCCPEAGAHQSRCRECNVPTMPPGDTLGYSSAFLLHVKQLAPCHQRNFSPLIVSPCLQTGHWTYECKNAPSYASRPTRTQQLLDPKVRDGRERYGL